MIFCYECVNYVYVGIKPKLVRALLFLEDIISCYSVQFCPVGFPLHLWTKVAAMLKFIFLL